MLLRLTILLTLIISIIILIMYYTHVKSKNKAVINRYKIVKYIQLGRNTILTVINIQLIYI
jgi:hypothetical protein